MKLWSARSKRDKAARIVLSLALVGVLAYGAPRVAAEVHDYVFPTSCHDAIQAAWDGYVSAASRAPASGPERLQAALAAEVILTEGVAEANCPEFAALQADFVSDNRAWIVVLEQAANGEQPDWNDWVTTQRASTDSWTALKKAAGVE